MCRICRDKAVRAEDQGLLALQKVEGSSPFSRFRQGPVSEPFLRLSARSIHRAGRPVSRSGAYCADLGISAECVRQLEQQALDTLHAAATQAPTSS
jgi:hypothetical protein